MGIKGPNREKGGHVPAVEPTSTNIIDLGAFRRRIQTQNYSVFYVNSFGERLKWLLSLPYLNVENINSALALRMKILSTSPSMVILESSLEWSNPITLIRDLNATLQVPQIMFYDSYIQTTSPGLLKSAFAAGLQDSFRAPVCSDDLQQSMDVLLKMHHSLQEPIHP